MALAGEGAVCIWNDITDEGRADFYAWHLAEHMPERAAIPGFLRGRRYRAADNATTPEFFTLYETTSPAVLTGAEYLARLNAPTPWTKRATQGFRNTSRALTRVATSLGPGPGGFLATLRFAAPAERETAAVEALRGEILAAIAKRAMISGAHLCLTDEGASASKTAESRDRTDILTAPRAAVLIEGCDVEPVRLAAEAVRDALKPYAGDATNLGLYGFEYERSSDDGARGS